MKQSPPPSSIHPSILVLILCVTCMFLVVKVVQFRSPPKLQIESGQPNPEEQELEG